MAEDFSEIRRNISQFLLAFRQSIDRHFLRSPIADVERERFMRTIMMVEEARIRFSTYTRYREEPTADEWRVIRKELLSFLDKFMRTHGADSPSTNGGSLSRQ